MSLFDKLKNQAVGAAGQAASRFGGQAAGWVAGQAVGAAGQAMGQAAQNLASAGAGGKSVSAVFASIPSSLAEFAALPQAAMQSPFDTAALFIVALGMYKVDKNVSISMINHLKGPQPLNQHDLSFLADRMAQNSKADFIAESYFNGATPQNNYAPAEPYTVVIEENPYSYQEQGCARLHVRSGGADNTRAITLRSAKDGKWYLWEYSSILLDIRAPESTNPWN